MYLSFMVLNPLTPLYIRAGERYQMAETTLIQFGNELKSFFGLALVNLIFGALVLGFGIQVIVTTFLQYAAGTPLPPVIAVIRIVAAGTGACIGLSWIGVSGRITRGLKGVRREYRDRVRAGPVPAEALTGWIVTMLAHYREHRSCIRRMILVSIAGGALFLALGIASLVQGILAVPAPATPGLSSIAFVGAALLNGAIGLVILCFAMRYRRYANTWDLRLELAGEGEDFLKDALESP